MRRVWLGLVVAALCVAGGHTRAQGAIAVTEPGALLPQTFGVWKRAVASPPANAYALANLGKDALEECGPQRSAVADYTGAQTTIHVEAIQFGDRSGAYSAFTLAERPGMKEGKAVGAVEAATSDGAILFLEGTTVVLVTGGSGSPAEAASLKPLADTLPKIGGSKAVPPMLPTLLPEKGLVAGSVRYALGPASYAAEGGVLPAQNLGWDKSAEAVTAQYADKRGRETLTVLLYPTPMIAGLFARQVQAVVPGLGPAMAGAQQRREGELVMLASGSFSADDAERMLENIHLRQQLSFDKDVGPVFHTEVRKTYSLLSNIMVLAGVGMLSAVLLGLFLGGGRAAIRVMRGKPAATELEFLSLHLDPKNAVPTFTPQSVEKMETRNDET